MMRLVYLFISIISSLIFMCSATAQSDSLKKTFISNLLLPAKVDSSSIQNQNLVITDTVLPEKSDSLTKVNNGKEISLDSLPVKKDSATKLLAKKDSLLEKKHIPRKATLRSAIIPGWGQVYNRQYWKLPIVYGVIGVPAGLFIYNNKWYQRTKDAYNILVNGGDSTKIYPELQGLDARNIQYFRNSFRRDRDYSVLFFFLAWGLQVADATVSAHLKDFDVSDDLSLHINPDFNINTKQPSISTALSFKSKQTKLLPASF